HYSRIEIRFLPLPADGLSRPGSGRQSPAKGAVALERADLSGRLDAGVFPDHVAAHGVLVQLHDPDSVWIFVRCETFHRLGYAMKDTVLALHLIEMIVSRKDHFDVRMFLQQRKDLRLLEQANLLITATFVEALCHPDQRNVQREDRGRVA